MKLTLAIATYNEEKNIHFALDSTIGWVDEVVVVDGGSTDKTLEVLRAYGDKVRIIETDNPPMFHVNKQKAIEAANGEWILQLDADEEVTPELRKEILGIVVNGQRSVVSGQRIVSVDRDQLSAENEYISPSEERSLRAETVDCRLSTDNYLAYQIPRKNFFLGRPLMKGGVYPDYTIRLYKKDTMRFPCKDVHENVQPINMKHETSNSEWLGTLENPMNHYSDPTFGRYLARWKRYNEAEAHRVLAEAKELYGNDVGKLRLWKAIFLIKTFLFLPPYWFIKTYVRHKGYADGWQGFVFHLMSAMRWWGIGGRVITL